MLNGQGGDDRRLGNKVRGTLFRPGMATGVGVVEAQRGRQSCGHVRHEPHAGVKCQAVR